MVPPVDLAPVQNPQGSPYTIEKFIKNGAKVFQDTTDPEKAEVTWTVNMLKSFRAMEVSEVHWVQHASWMFEDAATFSWDSALRTDFAGRVWEKFKEVFIVM